MDLADGDERRGWAAADCLGQETAVGCHKLPVIGGGEAEVQFAGGALSSITVTEPSLAGAEAVPKPGQLRLPEGNGEKVNAIGSDERRRIGAVERRAG